MDLGPCYCRGTWSNNCFSQNHWNPWSECKMDDNSNQRLKWFEVVILWEVRILIKHCWASRSYIKQGLFANTFKFGLLKNTALLSIFISNSGWAIEIGLLRVFRADELNWHACIGKNTAHIQASHWGVTPGLATTLLCWRFFFQCFYGCWENSLRSVW